MLENKTILVTGASGQVALPIVRALAPKNRVLAFGRFQKPEDRAKVEALGAEVVRGDLAQGELGAIPDDVDAVLHFAVARSPKPDFDGDLAANAEAAGLLMARCARAQAFLHCSTAAVYQAKGGEPARETDPLGDHHRVMMPTYSICKIAAEAVVRTSARSLGVPTTIARLGVPYGNNGGWPWYHLMMMKAGVPVPIHPRGPNRFPLLHEDDYVRHVEGLLALASVPATIVNWAGSEDTSIEAWCAHLAELTGLEPKFQVTEQTLEPLPLDVSKLEAKLGPSRVGWRDGIRRLVEARNPDLLKASA
jgi:nucleoside-diphosphate-sugar epimerase